MKYILMMNTMKVGQKGIAAWRKDEIEVHIGYMLKLNEELTHSGEVVSAEGLTFPDQARSVRADNDGTPVTDGVFPGIERVSGWLLDHRR